MGGRLSVPRAPDGISESPMAATAAYARNANRGRGRFLIPFTAATLGAMFLFYARTEPHAAKIEAERVRQAGSGDVNWRDESLRHHGQLPQVVTDRDAIRAALAAEIDAKARDPAADYQAREARDAEILRLKNKLYAGGA